MRAGPAPLTPRVASRMTCIFCRKPADTARVEHILPESLGGGDWACLPRGLVCGACNQYFGAKVEAPALGSFPFLPFRVLLGIRTKRNRAPTLESALGLVRGSPIPRTLGLDPRNDEIETGVRDGTITQVRILAEPTEPVAVCRLLLKMGLEFIAANSVADALSPRFDAARAFARSPQRSSRWWFLIVCDHHRLFRSFKEGISVREWADGVSLSTTTHKDVEVFHLKLLDMSIITPLEHGIAPSPELRSNEPDRRLFEVRP